MMKTFYVTFGQKYPHEETHPTGGHHNGWFEIQAADEDQAREIIFTDCGPKWAMMYTVKPRLTLYPLGCLKTLPEIQKVESS